jgi:small subunit ribosomal protein S8
MWSDPIADMLTRIRNGVRVRKRVVDVPASKVKAGIAGVLRDEGYIRGFDKIDNTKQGVLRIELKYGPQGEDLIHVIKRESRPGRRVYAACGELPRVRDGLGIAIVSTSRGVMSDRQCRESNLGGELLCSVY